MTIRMKELRREDLARAMDEFIKEDQYASRQFHKHFDRRAAQHYIPFKSLIEIVERGVQYDEHQCFDVRTLARMVHDDDRALFVDVVKFVAERYMGKPAGDLTLRQFRADLTRRLAALGF